MKKAVATGLFFFFSFTIVQAQYYYRDIISNKQLLAEMAAYKANKVHQIKINSFDADGSESDGFFCEKKITRDFKKTELFTRTNGSATSLLTTYFDDKGNLTETNDSSDIAVSHNYYAYDAAGRVSSIVSMIKSSDDDFTNQLKEEHLYEYNAQGIPVKMTRVKNNVDSTAILFATDEHNNVSIEKDSKSGGKYYYYYDVKNRLTDIVHFNEYKQKMLPDYVFEYNAADQLTQMTTTEEGGNNYYIWKYSYNNGLRSTERCFSKERSLLGRIGYDYK